MQLRLNQDHEQLYSSSLILNDNDSSDPTVSQHQEAEAGAHQSDLEYESKVDKHFKRFAVPNSTSDLAKLQQLTYYSDSDDAVFMCDLGKVSDRVALWRKHLPNIHPFYAVKCNDDPQLLRLLQTLGLGFDCASKGELQKLLQMGCDADQLLYANPCKQISHLKFAASNNVQYMTFDCENELSKVKKVHKEAKLILRIATDDSASVCQLGMKFGAPVEKCERLLKKARVLGLDVVGVSFHVGSGCLDARAFDTAIEAASRVFAMGREAGFHFTLLDIGGGFPGFTTTPSTATEHNNQPSFQQIASVIRGSLYRYFLNDASPWKNDLHIIAEPGRFFATSAFTLATCVISIKNGVQQSDSDSQIEDANNNNTEVANNMCYVNDGVYGSFNCLMFDHAQVTPKFMNKLADDEDDHEGVKCDYSLWGPTCDGLDRISEHCLLPATVKPNDWLYFTDMGAYTMSAASSFNGFPKPRINYIIRQSKLYEADGHVWKPFMLSRVAISSMLAASASNDNPTPRCHMHQSNHSTPFARQPTNNGQQESCRRDDSRDSLFATEPRSVANQESDLLIGAVSELDADRRMLQTMVDSISLAASNRRRRAGQLTNGESVAATLSDDDLESAMIELPVVSF